MRRTNGGGTDGERPQDQLDTPNLALLNRTLDSTASAALTRRELLPHVSQFTTASGALGWLLFLSDCLLYVAGFVGILITESTLLRMLLSILLGVIIGRLFVLGHDACHQSLFSSKVLNRWAGSILFLPSMTPYSLWAVGHNTIHHAYPNLKGRDPVWVPMSPREYLECRPWRRLLERIYRTVPGLAAYYFIEMWWLKLYFPSRKHVGARRREHVYDSVLVSVFLVAQAQVAIALAHGVVPRALANCVEGIFIPFIVWNWVVGFTIYVHHTHPTVRWFSSRDHWSRLRAQLETATHIVFPFWWSAMLHHIYDHTAHHLDVRIPSYRLRPAQRHLESILGSSVHTRPWSWGDFIVTLKECKVYDYERQRWLCFPTDRA